MNQSERGRPACSVVRPRSTVFEDVRRGTQRTAGGTPALQLQRVSLLSATAEFFTAAIASPTTQAMRSLSEILSSDEIELDLRAKDQESAILALAELLRRNPHVLDLEKLSAGAIEHEKASPTSTDEGVAFPHVRTDAVEQIVIAIGRSKAGIPFGKCGHVVHFVVLIGTPQETVREYLNVVGSLARRLKKSGVRADLMAATTAAEFIDPLR